MPEAEADDGVEPVYRRDKKDRADKVEIEMDHGGALGVLVAAQRGNDGGAACADVLAHDYGQSRRIGYGARGRRGLKYAYRRGRAVEYGRYDGADDYSEHGVFEDREGLTEGGKVI